MKKLLILLLLPCLVFGGINIWSSSSSTDGNLAANWSLGALANTDTLTFNNTSVINCTQTAAWDCAAIVFNTNYTGAYSDGGFGVANVSGAVIINTGGSFTATGTWTQDADADFVLTAATAWTITLWQIILQGTGAFKNSSGASRTVLKIYGAGAGKTTTHNGTHLTQTRMWELGSGTWVNSRSFSINPANLNDIVLNSGHAITGADNFDFRTSGSTTVNIPKVNASGNTGAIRVLPLNNFVITYDLRGNFVCGGQLSIYNGVASAITVNTNNFNITCGALIIGNSVAVSDSLTINFGQSVITCASYTGATYNVSTTKFNMGTSQWTCTGPLTFGSNHTVNPGTSIVNLTGTAAQTVTSAGKSFAYLTVNNSGTATVKFADSTNVLYDFSALDGRDSIGRLYVGGNYTNTSNDSVFHTDTTIINGSMLRNNDKTRRTGGAMSFRGTGNGTITLQDAGTLGPLTIRKSVGSATMTAASNIRANRILDSVGALKMLSYSLQCTTLTNYSSGLQCAAVTLDTLNSHASGTIGGGTITRWNWNANGIAGILAAGTTTTVTSVSGLGGTSLAPDTMRSGTPGSAATYTGPSDTLAHTYVRDIAHTNTRWLDSTASTGGGNTNVKSLSYTGATLSKATAKAGDTIGISAGNGLVGGAASIGDSAVTLNVVSGDSGWIVMPLAMPAGTYDVGLSNSDGDTLTLSAAVTVTASGGGRKANRRGWHGLGEWVRP